MLTAAFRFGAQDQHTCRLECDYFGRERYFVDERLVHTVWSVTGGLRSFEAAGHRIEIGIKLHLLSIECDAFVDGMTKASDLFGSINAKIAKARSRKVSKVFWIEVAVWLVLIVAVLAYRSFSTAG
jgi:hypothetical protein